MKNGFTLIEILIYIVILAMAIGGITLVAMNIFEVSARTNAIQEVTYNGRFAMYKIGYTIKESSAITVPENENDILEIVKDNDTVVTFQVSEEEKRLIMEKGEESFLLTTSRVEIDDIKFTKISGNSIRVEINISHGNPQNLPVQDFSNFFVASFAIR